MHNSKTYAMESIPLSKDEAAHRDAYFKRVEERKQQNAEYGDGDSLWLHDMEPSAFLPLDQVTAIKALSEESKHHLAAEQAAASKIGQLESALETIRLRRANGAVRDDLFAESDTERATQKIAELQREAVEALTQKQLCYKQLAGLRAELQKTAATAQKRLTKKLDAALRDASKIASELEGVQRTAAECGIELDNACPGFFRSAVIRDADGKYSLVLGQLTQYQEWVERFEVEL